MSAREDHGIAGGPSPYDSGNSADNQSFAWYQQCDAIRHHRSHLVAQTAGSYPWREVGKELGPVSLGEEEEGPKGRRRDDAGRARALFLSEFSRMASVYHHCRNQCL